MNDYIKKIKKRKALVLFLQIMTFVMFFALWELLVYIKVLDVFLFSKPSEILSLFLKYLKDGEIFVHIKISLYETIIGLLVGSAIGLLIASILWYFPFFKQVFEPMLFVFNALPKTALAPIFIIWVGTNMKGIIFVSISISLVVTIISLLNHFNNSSVEKQKMLESFGASRIQVFRYLVFPSNVLNIINTLKISVGMCFIGVIVGEFMVSKAGLGYLIMYGTQVFRLDLVMMSVVILALMSVLLNCFASLLEKKFKKGKYY